jgi:hypothetical protein
MIRRITYLTASEDFHAVKSLGLFQPLPLAFARDCDRVSWTFILQTNLRELGGLIRCDRRSTLRPAQRRERQPRLRHQGWAATHPWKTVCARASIQPDGRWHRLTGFQNQVTARIDPYLKFTGQDVAAVVGLAVWSFNSKKARFASRW